jgi:hypothetical protein
MGKPTFESLSEFFTEIDTYHGGWDAYREKFLRYPEENRIIELTAYDKLLDNESRPTRETAEFITKRRILGDIHNLLKRAGR